MTSFDLMNIDMTM